MYCYKCLAEPDKNVPLLKCGCYVCPSCYCDIKNRKLNECLKGIARPSKGSPVPDFTLCLRCDKKLIRGRKKNKN